MSFQRLAAIVCSLVLLSLAGSAMAQDDGEEKKKWSDEAELSLVVTQGNSDTMTIGFKNLYERFIGQKARFQFKVEGTQADKADDRFVLRENPNDPTTDRLIEPSPTDSIERYLAEGRYDRKITERFFWNAGASWDRNLTDGSGIDNRYIAFAGVGNIWWDRDDLKFTTNYGLSYTDREEIPVDPTKEDNFMGVRFDWSYLNKFGKNVTYTNTWTVNYSLKDSDDYNWDMVNAVSVSMTERLALKVGLQWLFNHLPPTEDVDLLCPNPIPNAPPVTCDSLGTGLPGEIAITKDKSDIIFTTSLVVKM